MKKNLLNLAAFFAAFSGLQAQTVTTSDEFLSALNNGTGDIVITIPASTTIDVSDEAIVTPAIQASVNSITIQGEGDSSVLKSKGAYDLTAVSELNAFKFNNLTLTREAEDSDYALAVKSSIKEITLEKCRIHSMRGVLRLRDNADMVIEKININNCLVSKIGSYSLISGEKGKVTSLNITNNTFYDFSTTSKAKNLITFKPAESGEQDVRLTNFCMENNTFNKVVMGSADKAANYLVDFGKIGSSAIPVSGSFSFQNNLLGEPMEGITKIFSKIPQSTDENYEQCVINGNFISESWTIDENSKKYFTDEEVLNQAPAVNVLFKDAANGDFTIAKEQAYSNAGDPRWKTGSTNIQTENVYEPKIIAVEYYNVAGLKQDKPVKGLNIIRQIRENGTIKTIKSIVR